MGLHLYDVIKRPVITEKSSIMAGELNQYVFEVDLKANKIQIKAAIEEIYKVEVVKVSTLILPMKRGRRGRKYYARSAEWKKAIVTLPAGQSIEAFNA
jgi:large subunit ribosomal protein L23